MRTMRQRLGARFYLIALLLLSACVNTGKDLAPRAVSPAAPVRATLVLPPDADRTSPDRQADLLQRGLYLTQDGRILALPASYEKRSWTPHVEAPGDAKAPVQSGERIVIDLSRPSQ